MLPPIFQTLKASQAVKDIVGTNPPRVYRHGSAAQDASRPYVAWLVVTDDPHNNLSDLPPGDRVSIQVDCYHQTDAGIVLHTSKDHVIFERREVMTQSGGPYSVFTPYKNAWLAKAGVIENDHFAESIAIRWSTRAPGQGAKVWLTLEEAG